MMNNYKTIKNLWLLSALNICLHGNVSAMEMDVDGAKMVDPDKLEIKTTPKRNNNQADLRKDKDTSSKKPRLDKGLLSFSEMPTLPISIFEEGAYFPDDVIDKIINYLDFSKDKDALLAFLATNTRLHQFIEDKYTKANEHENHHPWQVSLSLPMSLPSTLYIFNSHMRTILGLYVNIRMSDMADERDRIHFERLCSHFIRRPSSFLKNTLPDMYVELLQLSLSVAKPTIFQSPFVNDWKGLLTQKQQICSSELSTIASQENFEFQNEGALYFHYCQFVANIMPADLARLHNTPLFKRLNNSFMAVMDMGLLDLKNTQGLSAAGNFAPTWEEILALEPAITIQQYNCAAFSHYEAGLEATDQDAKLSNITKAVGYCEKELEAIRAVGQTPTYINYGNIATAYLQLGRAAADQDTKLANFTKAVGYYEKELEAIRAVGLTPTDADYGDIATAYFKAGEIAKDQDTKLANLTKAIGYCEKRLEAIRAVGQTPTYIDYGDIATAYLKAWDVAENVNVKVENYTKAHAYIEVLLEIVLNEEMTQGACVVLEEIYTYLSGYNKITSDKFVDEQQRDG